MLSHYCKRYDPRECTFCQYLQQVVRNHFAHSFSEDKVGVGREQDNGRHCKHKIASVTPLQQRWQRESFDRTPVCISRLLLSSAVSLHKSTQKTEGWHHWDCTSRELQESTLRPHPRNFGVNLEHI